jgi:hypothetical protein
MIVVIALSYLFFLLFSNYSFTALFVRRLFSIPAGISFKYYNFFSENEFLWFREIFIGRILNLNSPYPEVISRMLGNGANANTGIFGDAYANGGFIIMFVYSIILSSFLILVDSFGNPIKKSEFSMLIAIYSNTIFMLNDLPLTNVMLTGGGLILIFLTYIYFFSNNEIKSRTKIQKGERIYD